MSGWGLLCFVFYLLSRLLGLPCSIIAYSVITNARNVTQNCLVTRSARGVQNIFFTVKIAMFYGSLD